MPISTPAVTDHSPLTGETSLRTIGMLLHKPFPPDPRVAREAKALIQAGHRVFLLCLGRPGEPAQETLDGLEVVRAFTTEPRRSPEEQHLFALEPYNSRCNRLKIALGPLRLAFKIPRCQNYFQYPDRQHQSWVIHLGIIRVHVPTAWSSPWAWISQNRHFFTHCSQSTFFDPFWFAALNNFISQHGIEVLHVHDLPLVYTGSLAAQAANVPLVADLHENWPALVHINRAKFKTWHEKFRNRQAHWQAHERFCLNQAQHIIVVAEAAKARLVNNGTPAEKISVVSNTIDIDTFLAKDLDEAQVAKLQDRFVVSYVGGFGPHRGIDTLIQAAQLLKGRIPNLLLYLAGADGPNNERYLNYCRKLAKELDVDDLTLFTGWADDDAYRTYTALSDVGVVPHKSNEHTETTMPNKLYNYMLLKKPILCSNLRPLQDVLDETHAGLSFKAGDVDDLAAQLLRLYEDAALRETMGEAGHTWVYRKYNWQETALNLVEAYQTDLLTKAK